CAFNLSIKAESIDTGNPKRDDHLRSGDFFNAKQFPAITFRSTSVKPIKEGYEVRGDFTLHGVTRPVTFMLVGGRTAEFPKGVQRGDQGRVSTPALVLKRAEWGIEKWGGPVGDDPHISVSCGGTKKYPGGGGRPPPARPAAEGRPMPDPVSLLTASAAAFALA